MFLIARWDYYVDGARTGNWNMITDQSFQTLNKLEARQLYSLAVNRTAELYNKIPSRLVAMLQIPHQDVNPKRIFEGLLVQPDINHKLMFLKSKEKEFVSIDAHLKRQKVASSPWFHLSEQSNFEDLAIIDPTDIFCNNSVCPIYDKESSFYADDDHGSINGLQRLKEKFQKVMH